MIPAPMVGADRVKGSAGTGLHQVISAGLYRPRWSWPEQIDGPNYVGRFWRYRCAAAP
jgi:hypothetical protein